MGMLSKEVKSNLDSIVFTIMNSKEYQICLELKKQMDSNEEICSLTSKIKDLQKRYIRNQYDSDIKKELDSVIERLNQIPIYQIYNQNLEVVNSMINLVNDEINDYFDKKFNESIQF